MEQKNKSEEKNYKKTASDTEAVFCFNSYGAKKQG
jgi:hypothetical protein